MGSTSRKNNRDKTEVNSPLCLHPCLCWCVNVEKFGNYLRAEPADLITDEHFRPHRLSMDCGV